MPGTISFDGLATGINTTDTVDKLMEVESRPKILKEAEKVRYENQRDAWNEVDTKLLTLREEARTLWKESTWNTLSATSSDGTVLSATTTSSAAAGTYTFQVDQLAQNHQISSEALAATTDLVGTGNLVVSVGAASTTITLDGTQTLAGLADAINLQTDVDVTASVVNDGTGYRLLLSSDDSGAANTISLQRDAGVTIFDDATLGQSNGAGTPAYYDELEAAQDASIQFGSGANALTVTSTDNTMTGLISGVTLNLLAAKPGTNVTLSVARDSTGMEDQVQRFIDAYNDVSTYIQNQTQFDETTETRGVLLGDFLAQTIQSRLQGVVAGAAAGSGAYATLRSIGVTMEDDGALTFDTSTFSTAIQTDAQSVEDVFRGTNGVSEQLSDYLGDLTNPFGTIDIRTDNLDNTITRIQDRIDDFQKRLDAKRESLLQQFYAMEKSVNALNSQGTFLMNQLQGLSANWG